MRFTNTDARNVPGEIPTLQKHGHALYTPLAFCWRWLSLAVLCTGFAITYFLWSDERQHASDETQQALDFKAEDIESLILEGMERYGQVLHAVAGLYAASNSVTRAEFRGYAASLNLAKYHPGIQGLGYSEITSLTSKDLRTEAMPDEGLLRYSVRPEEKREIYTSVIFIEPYEGRNLRLLGYDMYADRGNRQFAMDRARDTGTVALSGRVILHSDANTDEHIGALMYMPVYKKGAAVNTVEERRTNIVGWVYAPFRVDDLIVDILGERAKDVNVQIHDDRNTQPEALIYQNNRQQLGDSQIFELGRIRILEIAGHAWTLSLQPLPEFVDKKNSGHAQLIGIGGIVTSVLVALLTGMLAGGRASALKASRVLQSEWEKQKAIEKRLADSQEKLRAIVETSLDAMVRISADGIIIDWNKQAERTFGWTREEAIGLSLNGTIIPLRYRQAHDDGLARFLETGKASILNSRVEIAALRRDGTEFPIELGITCISTNATREFTAFIRDITSRRRAQHRDHWRSRVMELLAKEMPLNGIMEAIAEGVEEENPNLLCATFIFDSRLSRFRVGAAPSLSPFYKSQEELDLGDPELASTCYRKRIVVEDLRCTPNSPEEFHRARESGVASYWSEPILSSDGMLLGTVVVFQMQTGAPSRDDIGLLEAAANLASIAIEQSSIRESLLLSSLVFRNSSEAMVVADAGGLIIGTNAAFSKVTGYSEEEVLGKNPRLLQSGRHDQTFYMSMWESLRTKGVWQGEVWNRRKNGEIYPEWLSINTIRNSDGTVHRYVALFYDLTEKKQAEELLWTTANFDVLTGLPNRQMVQDRLMLELEKAKRTSKALAFMIVDLDHFKHVNETLGNSFGDALLFEAAARIRSCINDSETIARCSGDEFAIILTDLTDMCRIESVAQAVLQALSRCFIIGNEHVYLSGSIGITMFPSDAVDALTLFNNADQAVYAAKREGRNRYSYFSSSEHQKAQARRTLMTELRSALTEHQLEVHFQPIADLQTGEIIKAEALLRWRHPIRGMVSPAEFIPLAEESGLINEIGDWVFREAADFSRKWSERLGRTFPISVNKSPVQFREQEKHASWPEHLKALGMPGGCITVEITEGLLLNATPEVNERLLQYRDAGICIAIDDFGTGYSAMAYLKKFHIDYLKIDQSFVRGMANHAGDQAIVEAIIVMSHKLGFKVIAEGIETEEQRSLLAAANCDLGQGYLFAKPLPPREFENLLHRQYHCSTR